MAFWLQLRLILWKNFIIRKRQKIRVVVELTWPLFLFLILMWVRTRGLRSNVGECHFTEKAMPSTGFLPFFQSFFCTFNNTCHSSYNSSLPKSGDLKSGFMKIFEEFDHVFRQSQKNQIDFRSVGPQVHNFSKFVENITEHSNGHNSDNLKLFNEDSNYINSKDKNSIKKSVPPDLSLKNSNLISKSIDKPPVKNYSLVDLQSFKQAFTGLEKSLDTLEFYSELLKNTWNSSTMFKSLDMVEVQNISGVEKILVLLYDTLCGREVSEALAEIQKIGGTTNRFDQLQDQFRERTKIKYKYDNETTPMCNKIFQKIEEYPPFSMLWRIMKPFLVGKILYTPVTEATKKVMERIDTSFYPFLVLHSFATNLPSEYAKYPQQMNFTSIADLRNIKEFMDSEYGKELIYKSLENDINRNDKFERSKRIINRLYESTMNLPEDSAELFENSSIIIEFLKCLEIHKVDGIDDQYEAEARGMQLISFNKLWALIEFESPGNEQLNPLITYKIRMNTERVDNTEYIKDMYLSPGSRRRPAIDLKYITYGFAYLQDMIDHSIIMEQTGKRDLPGIVFQQFPYPCYIDDEFIMAISRTFPLFMVLSWVYTCAMIVKSIVHEKEQRLKETMRVMGLGNTIHWIGWFIDSIIPMLFTIFLLTLILVYGNILRNSNPVVVYVFLFCYALATISQSFFISVFFSRANLAAASAGIIFFVLYLPYPFIVRWMFYLSSTQKFILSLSSNVAFGLGASYLALYEEKGTGIQWKYFASSPYYNDNFSLLSVVSMLLVDFVVYMVLTWYIEHVFPGQFGIPKPWYFPLSWNYWSGKDTKKVFVSPEDAFLNENDLNYDNYEPEPIGLKQGVSIHKLKKQYSNGKVAVNDISINFYEGQITSFLGHNGAGKTTTISILTGLFPPSSGTAKINGFDIRTDMDKIRKNLGMCPQHNVLFNRLTVEEHLWFYACLRGGKVSGEEINSEIDQMINDLGLPHKRKALSTDLSGGMQRKLSIAVSFIGGSKVVILDEPTSGVDPFSRRSIWELLLKYKINRTVILTTHYMDEADLLGDRIAIIANGKVQCCGSSVYLKNKYGSGYHLTIEIPSHSTKLPPTTQFDRNGDITDAYDPVVLGLTKYIQSIVRNAVFVEYIGSEASYILPDRGNTDSLMELCDHLEKDKDKLGILSYGISDTSLEEIFLRVAENDPANEITNNNNTTHSCWDSCFFSRKHVSKQKMKDSDDRSSRLPPEVFVQMRGSRVKYSSVPIIDSVQEKPDGDNIYWKQFVALHAKRYHHTLRNKKALFSELVLPAVFVCMSLLVSSIFPKLRERPPLVLEPWRYPPPNYMFYSNSAPQENWTEEYVHNMKGPDGIGAKCIIINGTRNNECQQIVTEAAEPLIPIRNSFAECSCESGAQVCPPNIGLPEPPYSVLATNDKLYNMTAQDISNWIVNTWPKYEEQRYGGYTFGTSLIVPTLGIADIVNLVYGTQVPEFLKFLKTQPKKTDSTLNNIKVWFNNKGWIASVAYMNAINNVVLRSNLPSNISSDYGIITINHPMNFTGKQLGIELIRQGGVSLLHAISVIFALSFVPASFVLYLIEERISHSKHLQLVSGVNKLIYWLQAFSWDLMAYLMSSFLCVLIFLAFNEQAYVSSTNFPGLLLLFLLYGWSCIPLMYPLSFVFSVPSSAFVSLSCANMFIGIITTVTTFVLAAFDDEELREIDNIIKEVFLIFPHFCLGDGLMKLATNHLATASLMNLDIDFEFNVFEWEFLGKNLLCMTCFGILFFFITLAIEFQLFNFLRRKVEFLLKNKSERLAYRTARKVIVNFIPGYRIIRLPFLRAIMIPKLPSVTSLIDNVVDYMVLKVSTFIVTIRFNSSREEEDDVAAEKKRVLLSDTSQDILVVKNLSKVYKRSTIPSVDQISCGVKSGECFGLLGLNGAGKTTTFKMLTGVISSTSGDATVMGYSIKKDINKVRALLGYCPQFDALDPLLTPYEHLILYGRIRNIPSNVLNRRVEDCLEQMNLLHYSSRLAGTLSGGNRRKLSTAIALIGNPPLIFLDEPTSGMDPKARRFLWSCIQDIIKGGGCVVLTSHSMEECQALCTKLTVMVSGTFRCFGTSQHLKEKYGRGYRFIIRCKEENIIKVKMHIMSLLPSAKLVEEHSNQLRYEIMGLRLSQLFWEMEKLKKTSLLLDYSVSQTTLEEVFLTFANDVPEEN